MFNKNILYRGSVKDRIYNNIPNRNIYDILYSELLIHLTHHFDLGYKIYYLQCKPKHGFSLTQKELDYLYTENVRTNEPLHYYFSENIKNIKYSQCSDLFFLSSLKNVGLIILIPKLDTNNVYYFNLILGVNKEFDTEKFDKIDFKSVFLSSFIELNNFNLNENYLKNIFDAENTKFNHCRLTHDEVLLHRPEIIGKGYEKSKFSTKGRRIYKKLIFKSICFHIY